MMNEYVKRFALPVLAGLSIGTYSNAQAQSHTYNIDPTHVRIVRIVEVLDVRYPSITILPDGTLYRLRNENVGFPTRQHPRNLFPVVKYVRFPDGTLHTSINGRNRNLTHDANSAIQNARKELFKRIQRLRGRGYRLW